MQEFYCDSKALERHVNSNKSLKSPLKRFEQPGSLGASTGSCRGPSETVSKTIDGLEGLRSREAQVTEH